MTLDEIRNKVLQGDSQDVLADFPDSSVDAIVCDPPYGLAQEPDMRDVLKHWLAGDDFENRGSGFMGKLWDSFVPGPNIWRQVFRVLKPGGYVLAFSGTRTFDLMEVSLEIGARFAERDFGVKCARCGYLAWIYGCLTEDAEILTEYGWKRGVEVAEGERVAMWNPETEAIELGSVEEKFLGPFGGELVAFKNDNTDQLLTPNHRVYKRSRIRQVVDGKRKSWFERDWNAVEAQEINRWNPVFVPLAGWHDGDGIGGEEYARLLAWVWTEGGFDHPPSTGVRLYQSSTNQAHVDEISALLAKLVPYAKHYMRARTYKGRPYTEHSWFFTGEMAQRVRADLPDKHPTWGLLWQMTQDEKRAFLDAAMKGDGSSKGDGKSWAFYQKDLADLEWMQALLHCLGMQGRINERKRCVALHDNPVTQFQERHLKAHHRVAYEGQVWCVKVATGAFVARRNGKVFITGNSGFPKSLDIGKAIDKMGNNSDAAKLWEGYGTALKPAHEPISVFAKANEDGTMPSDPAEGKACFLYCSKANADRIVGARHLYWRDGTTRISKDEYTRLKAENEKLPRDQQVSLFHGNSHPTVKPLDVCRWLVGLVAPKGGLVLDPFSGSGSVACGAILEGCDFVAVDLDPFSVEVSEARTHYFQCLGEKGLPESMRKKPKG